MSPTEFELRAALHDGEGAGLDPERIVAGAQAVRGQRRARLASAGAVAAVIVSAGVGGAVLWQHGGKDTATGGQGRTSDSLAHRALVPAGAAGAPRNETGPKIAAPVAAGTPSGVLVPCPSVPPRLLPQSAGSTGQLGSHGSLFDAPVARLVVCAYGSPLPAANAGSPMTPGRLVLTGDDATSLAASLDGAPKTRQGRSCADLNPLGDPELALIGVSADGTATKPIAARLTGRACDVVVTNGTAARYDWVPPPGLLARLTALRPTPGPVDGTPPGVQPSGKVVGSPSQS